MATSRSRHALGMLYMLINALCVAFAMTFAQGVLQYVSTNWLILLRFLVPFAIFVIVFLIKGFPGWPRRDALGLMVVRVVTFFLTQWLLFWYLAHSNIVTAVVMLSTSGLMIPILDRLVFKVPLSAKSVISIVLGFVGVLLVLDPWGQHWNAWAWVGFLAGFVSALGQIAYHKVAHKESPDKAAFYNFGFGLILSVILVTCIWPHMSVPQLHLAFHSVDFVWLILGFGLMSALVAIFRARSYACVNKAASVAPVAYFNLVFSGILGWVVYDQAMSSTSIVGVALMIVASLCLLYRKKEK